MHFKVDKTSANILSFFPVVASSMPENSAPGAAATAAPTQSTQLANTSGTNNGAGREAARAAPRSSANAQQGGSRNRSNMQFGSGRFILRAKLGSGSFGDIFRGVDTFERKEVAIKLEQSNTRHPQLGYESKVYKLLHGDSEVVGIPEFYWFGIEGEYNAMVIELCGPCLEDLFNYCMRKFSLKTVLMIAEQMLHRIEYIHQKGIIHRDIKPENYVFGLAEKGHHLHMIDFGLSKRFWDHRTRTHIPFREGKPLTGTARYCSTNTHRGYEQSRRDDLESIGFLLIYFMAGQLPWQGIAAPDAQSKTIKIGEKKMATALEDLCKECPIEFLHYMKYCRSLRFADPPDYAYLRQLFRQLMETKGYEYDWVFDWVVKREEERLTGQPQSEDVAPPSENPTQGASQAGTLASRGSRERPVEAGGSNGGGGGGTPRTAAPDVSPAVAPE